MGTLRRRAVRSLPAWHSQERRKQEARSAGSDRQPELARHPGERSQVHPLLSQAQDHGFLTSLQLSKPASHPEPEGRGLRLAPGPEGLPGPVCTVPGEPGATGPLLARDVQALEGDCRLGSWCGCPRREACALPDFCLPS